MFNVTVVTAKDNKKLAKKASNLLHIVELDHLGSDVVLPSGGANGTTIKALEMRLNNDLLRAE